MYISLCLVWCGVVWCGVYVFCVIYSSNNRKKVKHNRQGRPPLSVTSLDQPSLTSSTTTSVVPVKQQEELSFDIISRSSTLHQEEDHEDEEEEVLDTMHFEKLVEGERVESIILSPRSAQGYALASNRSPRSDQFIPNPSPTSSPRIEQTVIPPSPSPRRQLEDVVEQAVLNASEQSRDRSIQEKSNMDNEWKGPLYMQVSQIKSKNLKSIKWNGNNDPYVVISIGSWSDETDVVWSASEAFTWPHMNIVGACQTKEDATILFTLYNANLIRDDQVIGVGSVPLESFPRDTSEEVEVDIMEQGGKQRFRGTIMVQLTVTRDAMSTTSHCNSHHAGKDAKLAKVDSILANSNSNSEETPLNPPHSQTENELNRTSTSPKNQKAQPKYSRTNSTERMSKGERRGSTKAEPTGDVPESRNQRARSRRADVQEEDTRASRRTAHLPAPSAEEKLPRSRRQHASSQSLHEEKYQSESNQKTETETELALEEVVPKKSKSTSKKKKESSKKQKKKDLSHSEFIGNRGQENNRQSLPIGLT